MFLFIYLFVCLFIPFDGLPFISNVASILHLCIAEERCKNNYACLLWTCACCIANRTETRERVREHGMEGESKVYILNDTGADVSADHRLISPNGEKSVVCCCAAVVLSLFKIIYIRVVNLLISRFGNKNGYFCRVSVAVSLFYFRSFTEPMCCFCSIAWLLLISFVSLISSFTSVHMSLCVCMCVAEWLNWHSDYSLCIPVEFFFVPPRFACNRQQQQQ